MKILIRNIESSALLFFPISYNFPVRPKKGEKIAAENSCLDYRATKLTDFKLFYFMSTKESWTDFNEEAQ